MAPLQAIQGIREDLVNLSMELRLSVEMELSDMQRVISQLTSILQNLAERYRTLNSAYIKECNYRRRVLNIFRSYLDIQRSPRFTWSYPSILPCTTVDSVRTRQSGSCSDRVISLLFLTMIDPSMVLLFLFICPRTQSILEKDNVVVTKSTSLTAYSMSSLLRVSCFPR